jgi:hypothetical protein
MTTAINRRGMMTGVCSEITEVLLQRERDWYIVSRWESEGKEEKIVTCLRVRGRRL